jgi:hypothetical protein
LLCNKGLASFKYICIVDTHKYMVISNVEILSRQLTQFTATSEDNSESIEIEAKYAIDIQNNGILPTSRLSVGLSNFTYGSDNLLVSSETKSIGRLGPSSSKTVKFDISDTIEVTPKNLGLVQRSCGNKIITATSKEKIVGRLFSKSFSKSGGIVVISDSCSVPQFQQDEENTEIEPQPQPQPEPEPEPQPEPQPEPEPEPEPEPDNGDEDGENDGENNQDNGEQDNGEGNQEDEEQSEILGPNILSVGQNAQFRWSDFPQNTVTFRWQVLAEGESSNEPTTLNLAEGSAEELILDFVSEAEGDFLIRIIATANGQRLEQVQKIVSVIPAPAENT